MELSQPTIFLSSANINIIGDSSNDALVGGEGNETLNGGADNSVSIGGLGANILTVGLGADCFDFNLIIESVGTSIDTIADFSDLQLDYIDLSTIDTKSGSAIINVAFTFIGNNITFSNIAGQLRFDTASGILSGDIDGNGAADFEIQLAGVTPSLLVTNFYFVSSNLM